MHEKEHKKIFSSPFQRMNVNASSMARFIPPSGLKGMTHQSPVLLFWIFKVYQQCFIDSQSWKVKKEKSLGSLLEQYA